MLLYPSVDHLRTKVDSKYTLAVMAAKRARDLIDGKPALELTDEIKPLTIATDEIADDLISYKRVEAAEAEQFEYAQESEEAAEAAEAEAGSAEETEVSEQPAEEASEDTEE